MGMISIFSSSLFLNAELRTKFLLRQHITQNFATVNGLKMNDWNNLISHLVIKDVEHHYSNRFWVLCLKWRKKWILCGKRNSYQIQRSNQKRSREAIVRSNRNRSQATIRRSNQKTNRNRSPATIQQSNVNRSQAIIQQSNDNRSQASIQQSNDNRSQAIIQQSNDNISQASIQRSNA